MDTFPLNPAESLDTDNDTVGVPDTVDAESLNAANPTEITLPLDGACKGLQLKGAHDALP